MNRSTVLIVGDNDLTRKVVRVTLQAEGYTVLEAAGGKVALELIQGQQIGLILMDLVLPDADGLELVKQLRQQPGIEDIPIVAFSGFPARMAEARNPDLGFTDYLFKPGETALLVDTVRTHLPPHTGSKFAGRGRRVLVIDDDPIQRKLLKLHLEKSGFTVHTATDGLDGLDQSRRSPPDAIVSDMLMPRLDGFKFCLQVRQDPLLGDIPIVLTTAAFIEDADRKLAQAAGASAFVVRTPNVQEVIEALFTSLNDSSPVSRRPAVELPAGDYADRIVRQLEHQVKLVRDSEERMTRIFELMPVGIIFIDCSGAITFANGEAERIFGLPLSAITGRAHDDTAWKIAGIEGTPLGTEKLPLERIKRTGEPVRGVELSIGRSDGKRVVLSVNAAPLRDAEGHLLGIVESLADITERKTSDRMLKESEEKYKNIVELATDIIYLCDKDGNRTFMNDAGLMALEASPEEVIGRPFSSWIHPEDLELTLQKFTEMVRDGVDLFGFENRYVSKNGNVINVLQNARVLYNDKGEVAGTQGIAHDITERKRSEQMVENSEKRFRSLVENSSDSTLLLTAEGDVTYASPSTSRISGRPVEDFVGRNVFELLDVEDRDQARAFLADLIQDPSLIRSAEFRAYNKEGHTAWIEVTASNLLNEPGVGAVVVNWRDITGRKMAQQALRDSEERFRALASSAHDAIVMIDNDVTVSYWNDAAERTFGYTQDEALGRCLYDLIIPHRRREVVSRALTGFLQGTDPAQPVAATRDWRGKRKDGTEFPAEISFSKVKVKGAWNGIGIFRDITERKRAEAALRDSERRIRAMAEASVRSQEEERKEVADEVHDSVAQTLVAVHQHLSNALSIAKGDPRLRPALERVLDLQRQAIAETRNIMQELYSPALDIYGLVPIIEEELRRFREETGCRTALNAGSLRRPPMHVEGSVYRIFHEALLNIRKHCPKGTNVTVTVSSGVQQLSLEVKDDGPGFNYQEVSQEKRLRGLVSIRRRAELIGGTFELKSEPGLGTRVTVGVPHAVAGEKARRKGSRSVHPHMGNPSG